MPIVLGLNKINVTNVVTNASSISTGSMASVFNPGSLPSGWTRMGNLIYTGTCYIILGYNNTGTTGYTRIYRCTDLTGLATWTAIDLPAAHIWEFGAVGASTIVLLGSVISSGTNAITCYSTDDGATWTAGTTFTGGTTTPKGITYGNKFVLVVSNATGRQSTDGITWSNITLPTSTTTRLVYNSVINKWLATSGDAALYISTDSTATAWTNISTNAGISSGTIYVENIVSSGSRFIVSIRDGTSGNKYYTKSSTSGTTWTTLYTSTSGPDYSLRTSSIFDFGTGVLLSANANSNYKVTAIVGSTYKYDIGGGSTYATRGPYNIGQNNTFTISNVTYLLMSDYTTADVNKFPIDLGYLDSSRYVIINATKGSLSFTSTLYIKLESQQNPIYNLQASPGSIILMATADGVVIVTSYTNAKSVFTVFKNGVEQSGWSFSVTNDTGLTSAITGNELSVSELTTAVNSAYATIVASKSGETSIITKVLVTKNLSNEYSGINAGVSFSAFTTNNTTVGIKFLTTGEVRVKYGSGSYTPVGSWITPVNAVSPPGASWWIKVDVTGEALTTGTTGSWLQLNSDREFTLTKTTPSGTYTSNLAVSFGTSSSGGSITVGTGTLQVVVP